MACVRKRLFGAGESTYFVHGPKKVGIKRKEILIYLLSIHGLLTPGSPPQQLERVMLVHMDDVPL